jgi:hypothetical protein
LPLHRSAGIVRIATGSSASWLDPRLAGPAQPPARPRSTAVVRTWTIPLIVDGVRTRISGDVRWLPSNDGPPSGARPQTEGGHGHGHGPLVAVAAFATVVLMAVGWYARARRRRVEAGTNAIVTNNKTGQGSGGGRP